MTFLFRKRVTVYKDVDLYTQKLTVSGIIDHIYNQITYVFYMLLNSLCWVKEKLTA